MEAFTTQAFNEYLTVNEAAAFLGVSPWTLRNWDKTGKLTPMRHPMNGYRIYRHEELEAMLEAGMKDNAQVAQLKAILDHALVYVARCDLQHRFLYVNRGYAERFGRKPEDFIGKHIAECLGQKAYDSFRDRIDMVLSGKKVEFEADIHYKHLGHRVMRCAYQPEFDESNQVKGWVSVITDITERTRAERAQVNGLIRLNELAAQMATLHDPQSMLESVLSTIATLHRTEKGVISLYHSSTGVLQQGAVIGFDEEFKLCLQHVERGMGACSTAFLEKRRVVVEDTEIDPLFSALRELARTHGFRAVHSTPILTRAGECIGVLSVHFSNPHRPSEMEIQFADICARQTADFMERVKTEKALKDADRRKDEFLATLAHELRNPLAPIKNALHVLGSTRVSEETKEEARQLMQRQVRQMKRLIDDLMDASRINQGKIELKKDKVLLADILQSAIEITKPLITEKKHRLTIHQPQEPVWLEADMVRLPQVFANLLNNAAKYTNEGGDIELLVMKEATEVFVSLKDNGIGIPVKLLPSIFDMFMQVDNSFERSQGGLGIGLTLVKELVGLHGGSIRAHSDGEGKGSVFTLCLPLATQPAQSAEQTRHLSTAAVGLRVLIVDDNEASAKTLGWTLEMIGHEVKLVHHPKTAMETAKTFRPDVIMLDIGLPSINGYDLCKLLRQEPETKDAYIIAQTGWGQEEHRKRSKEAGFDVHLVKPIDMLSLEQLLTNFSQEQRTAYAA